MIIYLIVANSFTYPYCSQASFSIWPSLGNARDEKKYKGMKTIR